MWDQILLAYRDPSRVYGEGARPRVAQVNGDLLPTLLVDGRVEGVWRTAGGRIEVAAFRPLTAGEWDGVASEALRVRNLLAGRDEDLYRRFDHWWDKGLGGPTVRKILFE